MSFINAPHDVIDISSDEDEVQPKKPTIMGDQPMEIDSEEQKYKQIYSQEIIAKIEEIKLKSAGEEVKEEFEESYEADVNIRELLNSDYVGRLSQHAEEMSQQLSQGQDTAEKIRFLTLNSFKTKSSVACIDNNIISGNSINCVCLATFNETSKRFDLQLINAYVYNSKAYDETILARKVKKALTATGASFVVVDRGFDNSSSVAGLQLYCLPHLLASLLGELCSKKFKYLNSEKVDINFNMHSFREELLAKIISGTVEEAALPVLFKIFNTLTECMLFNKKPSSRHILGNFMHLFGETDVLDLMLFDIKYYKETIGRPLTSLCLALLTHLEAFKQLIVFLKEPLSEHSLDTTKKCMKKLKIFKSREENQSCTLSQLELVFKFFEELGSNSIFGIRPEDFSIAPLYRVRGILWSNSNNVKPKLHVFVDFWQKVRNGEIESIEGGTNFSSGRVSFVKTQPEYLELFMSEERKNIALTNDDRLRTKAWVYASSNNICKEVNLKKLANVLHAIELAEKNSGTVYAFENDKSLKDILRKLL